MSKLSTLHMVFNGERESSFFPTKGQQGMREESTIATVYLKELVHGVF